MKKALAIAAISFIILGSFSSCKKCKNCHFEYTSPISGEVKQNDPSEYCGSDLDEIEGAATVAGIEGEYICE